jgi:thiamine biosynthesis lipoprotein
MMGEHDTTFRSMGSDVRLLIGAPLRAGEPDAVRAAVEQRAFIADYAARLSRFVPHSELSSLNADPRVEVPAGRILRDLVAAGVWAAERSGGLVDPTLLSEVESAGYRTSLAETEPASLAEALSAVRARAAAGPHPAERWRQIVVDDRRGVIRRPPGVRIDSGGIGKGLAADLVAFRLCAYSRFVVDCGGDLAVGGVESLVRPFEVEVRHPLTRETVHVLRVSSGGVATSGLDVRVWKTAEGFAHHLIDPARGRPAWTGLIGATALGASAVEAETLAKTALLLGPEGARGALADQGGLVFHDNGDTELIGPIDEPPRMRLRAPRLLA